MASVYKSAVAQAVQDQPMWLRYKGSLLIIASGVAAVLAQLAASPDIQSTALPIVLTTAATVVTTLVNRFTKDGVTPSSAAQLEQAGLQAHLDRPSITTPVVEASPVVAGGLPVYEGESTGVEYVGEHRAGGSADAH